MFCQKEKREREREKKPSQRSSSYSIDWPLTFTPSAAHDLVSLENNYITVRVDFEVISSSGNSIKALRGDQLLRIEKRKIQNSRFREARYQRQ